MPDEGVISYGAIRKQAAPRIRQILDAMAFEHLPPELAAISKPFCDLAHLHAAAHAGMSNVHLEQGLWKLLEAKDAMVRVTLAA